MIVIVIVQLPEACMQYRNIISMGKAREMTASIIIYIQSIKGLVGNDNYFIFMDTISMFWPSRTV